MAKASGAAADLVDAARSIREVIEASALESEAARTLCPAAIEALWTGELWRMMTPRELGGAEADPLVQMEVMEEVSRSDGSAGWSLAVGAASLAMAGAFLSDEAVAEIFSTPALIMAGQVVPRGAARAAPGGYEVSGSWTFGSGCRHSGWLLGGCVLMTDGVAAGAKVAFFPREKVELHDTWHVAGLKGTGSCDYSVEPTLVREGYAFDLFAPKAQRGGPLYRMPLSMLVAPSHSGIALGLGRRALDDIAEFARGHPGVRGGPSLADRPVFQMALAKSEAALHAARLLVVDALNGMWACVSAGETLSLEQRALVRLAVCHVTDMAAEAASMAYRFGGSRVLFDSNRLQRCFRDIHAASQHVFVGDETYERFGQSVLGNLPAGVFL